MSVVLYRVKVYKLNPDDNQWVDSGTGNVSLDFVEKFDCIGITVISEEDNNTLLLQTKVCAEDIYQRQQDTLIVWNEPESDEDLALSFVDKKSCLELWNLLCKTQQKYRSIESELPIVNVANLELIDSIISSVAISNKEGLGLSIYSDDSYIESLFSLSESLERVEDLEHMYSIFKGMILLNEPNLLDILISDENILKLVDILQNDPKIPKSKRINHREFLTNVSVFKEVIPFQDEDLISKIHQTFRIKYLRDSVLLSELDDLTCSTLNTMIYYNNIEVLTLVQNNQQFLNNFFTSLLKFDNTIQYKTDLIAFLQQFCELAKNLQDESRITFYKTLQQRGLFKIFEIYFKEDNLALILPLLDVLNNTTLHLPLEFREYLTSKEQEPDYPSFTALIDCLITTPDQSIMGQTSEIIRRLIDIEDVYCKSDEFLNIFYQNLIEKLLKPIDPDANQRSQIVHYNLVNNLLDIFTFSVPKHSNMPKFLLDSSVIQQSLRFLNGPGFLTLSVLRFFRAIINLKSNPIEKKLMRENLFEPILTLFRNNGYRNNMINSAILEIFSNIEQSYLISGKLIGYLVETYREDFEKVTLVDTCKNLITKYEQSIKSLFVNNPERKRSREEWFADLADSDDEDENDEEENQNVPQNENLEEKVDLSSKNHKETLPDKSNGSYEDGTSDLLQDQPACGNEDNGIEQHERKRQKLVI